MVVVGDKRCAYPVLFYVQEYVQLLLINQEKVIITAITNGTTRESDLLTFFSGYFGRLLSEKVTRSSASRVPPLKLAHLQKAPLSYLGVGHWT